MNVSSVSAMTSTQNIYVFQNTHYNQNRMSPVSAVAGVGRTASLDGQEDRSQIVAAYQSADGSITGINCSREAMQREQIRERYTGEQEAVYDLSNPYQVQQMSAEGMLLTGMNVDMLA